MHPATIRIGAKPNADIPGIIFRLSQTIASSPVINAKSVIFYFTFRQMSGLIAFIKMKNQSFKSHQS
jgi:hypothetical protein